MRASDSCQFCESMFTPTRKGHRFCSRECQLAARASSARAQQTVHVVIPDTQVKPGSPIDHLYWIGAYIEQHFAWKDLRLRVIHLGDHWDMPSLSSYDKGKRSMEGRRYRSDIAAGRHGWEALTEAWRDLPADRHFLFGNHENRIERAIANDAQLEGVISLDDCETPGWQRHPFLQPVTIDGVRYAHYFYNPMTGRSYGAAIDLRLKTLGHSFTMGHQQTLLYGLRFVGDQSQHGLVAGSCYLHDEEYRGPQGQSHWRGIIVCHDVHGGTYDPMFVSLDYLCRRYEGVSLARYRPHILA